MSDIAMMQQKHQVDMERARLALDAYDKQMTGLQGLTPILKTEEVRKAVLVALGLEEADEG